MKLLINALVKAGFTVSSEDQLLPHITALINERTDLKAENQKHVQSAAKAQLVTIRAQMSNERDPAKRFVLAKQCRTLRGDGDLFNAPEANNKPAGQRN